MRKNVPDMHARTHMHARFVRNAFIYRKNRQQTSRDAPRHSTVNRKRGFGNTHSHPSTFRLFFFRPITFPTMVHSEQSGRHSLPLSHTDSRAHVHARESSLYNTNFYNALRKKARSVMAGGGSLHVARDSNAAATFKRRRVCSRNNAARMCSVECEIVDAT